MTDALRDNRTDSALIRVIVPVIENNIDRAMATAADFVKVTFTPIRQQMPVSQAAERDLETWSGDRSYLQPRPNLKFPAAIREI